MARGVIGRILAVAISFSSLDVQAEPAGRIMQLAQASQSPLANPFPVSSDDPAPLEPATNVPLPTENDPPDADMPFPENPFPGIGSDGTVRTGRANGCGAATPLGRSGLRKPEIAQRLCERDFVALDPEWIFILNYVIGFNEFLEERGSYLDPSGACARAAEPRRALGLMYRVIDILRGKPAKQDEDARLKEMLRPFQEDWMRAPLILWELRAWKKEGGLDAANIASLGLCGDPSFDLFWTNAIEYAQRIPGERQ